MSIATDLPSADWLPAGWLMTKLETEADAERFSSTYRRMGAQTKTAPAKSGGHLVAWSKTGPVVE